MCSTLSISWSLFFFLVHQHWQLGLKTGTSSVVVVHYQVSTLGMLKWPWATWCLVSHDNRTVTLLGWVVLHSIESLILHVRAACVCVVGMHSDCVFCLLTQY